MRLNLTLPVLAIPLNTQLMRRGSVQFHKVITVTLLSFQFMGYHTTMSVGELWGTRTTNPCAFYYNTRILSVKTTSLVCPSHKDQLGDDDSHIWSYAAGLSEVVSTPCNCPCAKYPGDSPSSYVGTDYYCDTATVTAGSQQWYTNNTLWDGKDCYPGTNCCANTRLPWFWRTLKQETNNDITVRWCTAYQIQSENFGTELLEIYIH